MPDQVLWSGERKGGGPRGGLRAGRVALLLLWAAVTAAFAGTLYRVLSVETPTGLQVVFLVLSTLCFAWVATGSMTCVLGFITLASGRSPDTLALPHARPPPGSLAALLFPVHREEAEAVAAAIDAVCRDLEAAGALQHFHVFILSDTQDPASRREERRVYGGLHRRWQPAMQIYVRWRTPNAGRKAGNIRDWIERFGAAYRYFVVFDADSMMTADALLRLVGAMEQNPRAGLIQTVPRLVGGRSLFGRLQQFAGGYYGPIMAAGLASWYGPDGNYWGHNAIVRTEAFAASAGLPPLPGPPPLGGQILSHDFVEAALLRRAGWEVHLVPSLEGSYEGCPPTLTDLIVRDRRWAQGNLQHLRLLTVEGMCRLSRVHLLMGACSYLVSPVWAVALFVGVILALQAEYATPSYFGSEVSLFPKWPVFDAQTALALFVATMLVIHLPKILGAAWALRSREERRRQGGAARLIAGVLVESVFSILTAPLLMVSQTGAVLSVLLGRDAGWGAQRRMVTGPRFPAFARALRWHLAWGLSGAALCAAISIAVLSWMSPILLSLLLAPVIASATAAPAPRWLAELLATRESLQAPNLPPAAKRRRKTADATSEPEKAGRM